MKKKLIGVVLTFFITISTLFTVLALKITPVTLKRDIFVYEYGSMISNNPADYVNANESVIGEIKLNFSNLKNEIGMYQVSATYAGVELPFYIKIQDTTKPVVTLKQVIFNVNLNERVSALSLLDEVQDKSEIKAYFVMEDGSHRSSIQFVKKGSFVVNIVVEDASGNQASKLRAKIVVGSLGNHPTLEGINDVEIVVGTHFDFMDGVKATDGNGNDITNSIKILKNTVNVNDVGVYEIIYYIANDQGNSVQKTRKVEVIENSGKKSNVEKDK